MKFTSSKSEAELQRAHPALRAALELLDGWHQGRGYPEMIVTDVADGGTAGRGPLSWHMPHRLCAADIRTSHYSPEQLAELTALMGYIFMRPSWELIVTAHGTGPHIHLARRDHSFSPQPPEVDHA